MKQLLLMAGLVAMVGCTSPVTDPGLLAQCGPKPSQADAERLASWAVSKMPLKDPESARITAVQVDGPMEWRATPEGKIIGWQISFYVNAKNSYGGYVGPQRYVLIRRADGWARYQSADAWHP